MFLGAFQDVRGGEGFLARVQHSGGRSHFRKVVEAIGKSTFGVVWGLGAKRSSTSASVAIKEVKSGSEDQALGAMREASLLEANAAHFLAIAYTSGLGGWALLRVARVWPSPRRPHAGKDGVVWRVLSSYI